jgi:hypothetical protein
MKKRTIWFCVVMVMAAGTTETMYESTNRIEVEEFADVLNNVETDIDIEYIVTKRF